MGRKFLIHTLRDNVGVAVVGIGAGDEAEGTVMENHANVVVRVRDPIPFGHKFALVGIPQGAEVIRYGSCIGVAVVPISQGEHVHTHNVKSARCESGK